MKADNNGVQIFYEVHGQGRPVVLLHGFPDSGRVWRHQVPVLTGAGFQVIVLDMRGYGESDQPADIDAYGAFALAAGLVLPGGLGAVAVAGPAQASVDGTAFTFKNDTSKGQFVSVCAPAQNKCNSGIVAPGRRAPVAPPPRVRPNGPPTSSPVSSCRLSARPRRRATRS